MGTESEQESVRGIDAEPVSEWLETNVDGARRPFRFSVIKGGHSNLTYRVDAADGACFVLRRPPLGAVLATAHDMGREYRIISALVPTNVPASALQAAPDHLRRPAQGGRRSKKGPPGPRQRGAGISWAYVGAQL